MKKITLLITLLFTVSIIQAQDNVSGGFDDAGALLITEADDNTTGSTLRISGEHTFEFWAKGDSGERGYLFTIGTKNSFQSSYRIDTHDTTTPSKLRVVYTSYDASTTFLNLTTTADVFDNTWHHIAVVGTTTSGTTTTKVYVDGVLDVEDAVGYTRPTTWVNTDVSTSSGITNQFAVGGRSTADVANAVFQGELDEVRSWTVARTATQIADESCTIVDATGLHRHFKFNNDTTESAGSSIVTVIGTGVSSYGTANCATASTQDNVLAAALNIYPNPAKSIVKIESKAGVNLKSVALYSILGQEVYRSLNTKSINVANFSKGLYVLKIESIEGAIAIKKLIVE